MVDGSIIPANLGVNPSLTITAMAEHAMSHVPPRADRTDGVWATPRVDLDRGGCAGRPWIRGPAQMTLDLVIPRSQ